VTVVGMSVDPPERLARFRDKYSLGFALASDADRAVGAAYGTLKTPATGSHERDTVLIAPDGTILLAYQRARAAGHAAAVLAAATDLKSQGII
jgi:thioredoxin-dependent peroxiredoxin